MFLEHILWRKSLAVLALVSICFVRIESIFAEEQGTASEQRFISLAPHITELLYAVGAGDEIVGAVSYSDFPKEAEEIPRIGSYDRINYEEIIALQPTLIFGWESGNGKESLERLGELGLRVYSHEPRTLEDVGSSLKIFGELTQHIAQGEKQSQLFADRLEKLRREYSNRTPVSLFYQLWNEPNLTINDDHLISDVIRLCGGSNIFADAIPLVPKVGAETVVRRAPEVIVATGMTAERPAWLDDWKQWSSIPAVKNNFLFSINPDWLHRHSPRILDGAEQMCGYLEKSRMYSAQAD